MVFADIEKLKQQYTDKYVVVDGERPELARFRDLVGQVKTVNMSGRALVEFQNYHLNIGWYDIALDFLKVVDKPLPVAEKGEAKKAPAKAAPMAPPAKAPAKATAAPAGKSTADILAAARGGGAPPKPATPKDAAGKPSTADILAAARDGGKKSEPAPPKSEAPAPPKTPAPSVPAASPATKIDRSKMSVADMLAAARSGGAAGSSPTAALPPEPASATSEPAAASAPAPASPPAEVPAKQGADVPSPPISSERVDKSKMSIDEMIAWCRARDAQ